MIKTILAGLIISVLAFGADWPMFKGNATRDGNTPADSVKLPLNLNTILKLPAPILASPAVVNNRVFIQDELGNVVCVDGPLNQLIWQKNIGGKRNVSSPCIWKGRVFIGSSAGGLCILDAATGDTLNRVLPGHPVTTSPAAANNGLYFSTEDGILAKVDSAGTLLWQWTNGGRSFFDFAIKDSLIVFPAYNYTGLIDRGSRADSVWGFTGPYSLGAVIDGSNQFYTGYALAELVQAERFSLVSGASLGVVSCAVQGQYIGLAPAGNLPSIRGTNIYWGTSCGVMGGAGWVTAGWNISGGILDGYCSSPALSANYCVYGSQSGKLYFFPVNSTVNASAGLAFQFAVLDTSDHGHRAIMSSPAVSNGRVYFGSLEGYLYGLGNGAPVTVPGTKLAVPKMTVMPSITLFPNPALLCGFTIAFKGFAGTPNQPFTIGLYDVQGQRVAVISEEMKSAPNMQVNWNGRDTRGKKLAAGNYFVHISLGSERKVFPVALIR